MRPAATLRAHAPGGARAPSGRRSRARLVELARLVDAGSIALKRADADAVGVRGVLGHLERQRRGSARRRSSSSGLMELTISIGYLDSRSGRRSAGTRLRVSMVDLPPSPPPSPAADAPGGRRAGGRDLARRARRARRTLWYRSSMRPVLNEVALTDDAVHHVVLPQQELGDGHRPCARTGDRPPTSCRRARSSASSARHGEAGLVRSRSVCARADFCRQPADTSLPVNGWVGAWGRNFRRRSRGDRPGRWPSAPPLDVGLRVATRLAFWPDRHTHPAKQETRPSTCRSRRPPTIGMLRGPNGIDPRRRASSVGMLGKAVHIRQRADGGRWVRDQDACARRSPNNCQTWAQTFKKEPAENRCRWALDGPETGAVVAPRRCQGWRSRKT